MAQVSVTTANSSEADATTHDVTSHVHAAGEIMVVFVMMESVDGSKEVDSVTWDPGDADDALARFGSVHAPSHGKLQQEVWFAVASGVTAKTATLRVVLEASQKASVHVLSILNAHLTVPLSTHTVAEESSAATDNVSMSQNADDLGICLGAHNNGNGNIGPEDTETEHTEIEIQGAIKTGTYSQDGDGSISVGWAAGGGNAETATLGVVIETAVAVSGRIMSSIVGAGGLAGAGGIAGQGGGLAG